MTHYNEVTELENETNPYARMVSGQNIIEIPEYVLECGDKLYKFPVAYKTWGRLNKSKDNVILVFHAFTGSSDVSDWWGPLLGTGKTFDPSRFFIVCINMLGSPYGSCSPLTIDRSTGKPYGPSFPLVTIKDDLGIQKLVLDYLGINSVLAAVGGSMGGMIALEFSASFNNSNYVKSVIAIATAARTSAWCISWNETQRQCIFSDPNYRDGFYYESEEGSKPISGLAAARMAALLTYRSRNSFEARFGRELPSISGKTSKAEKLIPPKNKDEENWLLHNDGSRNSRSLSVSSTSSEKPQTYFTAQTYLRYQGEKFIKRFDANCYIALTRKLDTHDITRGRVAEDVLGDPLPDFLTQLKLPHLVVGIKSDGLFTYGEQQILGKHIPDCSLKTLTSQEGHDAFLLEFKLVDGYCSDFMKDHFSEFYDESSGKIELFPDWKVETSDIDNGGNSVFGEAEKDITQW